MKDVSSRLLKSASCCGAVLVLLTGLWAIIGSPAAHAQEAPRAARAQVDTQVLKIGAPLTYQLSVRAKAGTAIQWPSFQDSLGAFEVLEQTAVDTASINETVRQYQQTLTLTSFEPGRKAVPAVRVPYKNRNEPDATLRTDSFEVVVETVQVDSARQIQPIKGLLEVPLTFRELLPYILGGVGILALGGLGYWLYRRWKRRQAQPTDTAEKLQLPHEKALANLEALEAQQLWQQGYIKEYHDQLTDIVRDYLERILEIRAMELTTSEIMEALANKPLSSEQQRQLRELFTMADMAKFAKAQPSSDENQRALSVAYQFIRESSGPKASADDSVTQESNKT